MSKTNLTLPGNVQKQRAMSAQEKAMEYEVMLQAQQLELKREELRIRMFEAEVAESKMLLQELNDMAENTVFANGETERDLEVSRKAADIFFQVIAEIRDSRRPPAHENDENPPAEG